MQTQCWSSKAAGQERVWRMAEKAGRRWSKENVCRQTAVTVQRHAAFRKTQILSASKSNRETSETQDIFSLNFCRRLNVRKKKLHREPAKNYFPLPNGIYQLGLSAGAIAVYGYLLYIENRETYQCHASYATIGNADGMSRNTVRKYVQELERRVLILTERTTIITQDGRIQNGSLLYTILPIQLVIEQFYQEQFKDADIAREQQRIEKLMAQRNAAY